LVHSSQARTSADDVEGGANVGGKHSHSTAGA
jgi:hypothetical protein